VGLATLRTSGVGIRLKQVRNTGLSLCVCVCISLLSSEGNPAGDGVMCHGLPVCCDSLRDIDLTGQAISRPGY
jgi:hypothetical protein